MKRSDDLIREHLGEAAHRSFCLDRIVHTHRISLNRLVNAARAEGMALVGAAVPVLLGDQVVGYMLAEAAADLEARPLSGLSIGYTVQEPPK